MLSISFPFLTVYLSHCLPSSLFTSVASEQWRRGRNAWYFSEIEEASKWCEKCSVAQLFIHGTHNNISCVKTREIRVASEPQSVWNSGELIIETGVNTFLLPELPYACTTLEVFWLGLRQPAGCKRSFLCKDEPKSIRREWNKSDCSLLLLGAKSGWGYVLRGAYTDQADRLGGPEYLWRLTYLCEKRWVGIYRCEETIIGRRVSRRILGMFIGDKSREYCVLQRIRGLIKLPNHRSTDH